MIKVLGLLLCSFLLCTCKKEQKTKDIQFANYLDWWKYHNKNIDLSKYFDGQSTTGKELTKSVFLDSLQTGHYIPIKISDNKLKLQKITNKEISFTISQLAQNELFNMSWEHKIFPTFEFRTLDDKIYTSENTKNKTVFLKTYYIHCQSCNEEMPQLNEFIEKNKTNPDLIFLSLATDDEKKLKSFLQSKNYRYQFSANQDKYIKEKLKTNIYPTHFIIKNGKILKVYNDADKVIAYFEGRRK